MLLPYVKFFCHKCSIIGNSISDFSISTVVFKCIFATDEKNAKNRFNLLTPCHCNTGLPWLVFICVHVGTFCGFSPSFFCTKVIHFAHDHNIHYKWHVFVILYFVSCLEPPLCIFRASLGNSHYRAILSLCNITICSIIGRVIAQCIHQFVQSSLQCSIMYISEFTLK